MLKDIKRLWKKDKLATICCVGVMAIGTSTIITAIICVLNVLAYKL